MKYKPGVNLALQQDIPKQGRYYSEALGEHPECMAVVKEDGALVGYNFYGFPHEYMRDGQFHMPCPEPGHLLEVDGRPPTTLSGLLAQLAAESCGPPILAVPSNRVRRVTSDVSRTKLTG